MGSRRWKIALTLSILLNIFLVAGIAGGALWLRTTRPTIGAGSLRIAGAELAKPQRRAFRTALRAARQEARPLAIADHEAREQAAAVMRAPVLDQAVLAAALSRVRDADIALRGRIEMRAVAFVATLPQADREKLADGLVRRSAKLRRAVR